MAERRRRRRRSDESSEDDEEDNIWSGVSSYVKGARGEGGQIKFFVVSDRDECQLPDAFYLIKIYCS